MIKEFLKSTHVEVCWVNADSFLVSSVSGHNASKWVFRIAKEIQCVVALPSIQARAGSELCYFLSQPISFERFRRENSCYYGVEYVLAIETHLGVYRVYALQENFRLMGELQPFSGGGAVRATWGSRSLMDSATSSCYVAFYVSDDKECKREVVVYCFSGVPLVFEEVLRISMFPGEADCYLSCSFSHRGPQSLLYGFCSAPGREELRVYQLDPSNHLKAYFQEAIRLPGAISFYGKQSKDVFWIQEPSRVVAQTKDLQDIIYQQLPPYYQLIKLENNTKLLIRELVSSDNSDNREEQGKKSVYWREKHVLFPFLLLPSACFPLCFLKKLQKMQQGHIA